MKSLLLTLLITFSCTAYSQIPAKPSLEELNALNDSFYCEDRGSNVNIRDCYLEMARKYEVVLNDLYKQLINEIPKKFKVLLIESERKWIAYKDSEIKLRLHFGFPHGNAGAREMNIFRERTEYINTLLEGTRLGKDSEWPDFK
jgi:uncharacterized protein YecT (DUF1311 family)